MQLSDQLQLVYVFYPHIRKIGSAIGDTVNVANVATVFDRGTSENQNEIWFSSYRGQILLPHFRLLVTTVSPIAATSKIKFYGQDHLASSNR